MIKSICEGPCAAERTLCIALILNPPLALDQLFLTSHLPPLEETNGMHLLFCVIFLVGLFKTDMQQLVLETDKPREGALSLGIIAVHFNVVDIDALLDDLLHVDGDVKIDGIIVASESHHSCLLAVEIVNYPLCLFLTNNAELFL
jgi:hypothetical protein